MAERVLTYNRESGSYEDDELCMEQGENGQWELRAKKGNCDVIDKDQFRFDLAERHGLGLVS